MSSYPVRPVSSETLTAVSWCSFAYIQGPNTSVPRSKVQGTIIPAAWLGNSARSLVLPSRRCTRKLQLSGNIWLAVHVTNITLPAFYRESLNRDNCTRSCQLVNSGQVTDGAVSQHNPRGRGRLLGADAHPLVQPVMLPRVLEGLNEALPKGLPFSLFHIRNRSWSCTVIAVCNVHAT